MYDQLHDTRAKKSPPAPEGRRRNDDDVAVESRTNRLIRQLVHVAEVPLEWTPLECTDSGVAEVINPAVCVGDCCHTTPPAVAVWVLSLSISVLA